MHRTTNQFIVHFSLHQKPTDTTTLIPHLEFFQAQYGCLPEIVTADAGYGCEENYARQEAQQIQGYVKYNYFHKEQTGRSKRKTTLLDPATLNYDEKAVRYICPMGQSMEKALRKAQRNGYRL